MRKNKALIPQYFDFNFVYKFLSNKKFLLVASGKVEHSGFCHVRFFTYLSVAIQNMYQTRQTWQRYK